MSQKGFIGKIRVAAGVCAAALACAAFADSPDALVFYTGGSPDSTAILSVDAAKPDLVFAGESLDEYEPAYACFHAGSASGEKYYVCPDLNDQILRPYNVRRTGTGDGATMTVQFQGLTRTTVDKPYTASVTVKFIQQGGDIKAYVAGAASLKPLDVELGLDLDAMVAGGDARAVSRPVVRADGERTIFNLSTIAMRKPSAPVEYLNPREGDSIGGTYAGSAAVNVTRTESPSATTSHEGYIPVGSWTTIAENESLADLDAVAGTMHVHFSGGSNHPMTAYNLKYTIVSDRLGEKTCQFQYDTGSIIACVIVEFKQDGDDVKMFVNQWRGYYINKAGYEDEVVLGMDFEKYGTGTTPKRNGYSAIATSDTDSSLGVKDLTFAFRSRATVANEGYLPNANDDGVAAVWTVVAANHSLSDLVEAEAFYHTGANAGCWTPGVNLKTSGSPSVQFQKTESTFVSCVGVDLRQNGPDIEARTGHYRNWYMYMEQNGVTYPEVKYGVDFYNYGTGTLPKREYYSKYVPDDASTQRGGIKNIRLKFATGGIVYAADHTSTAANTLTFAGADGASLGVSTISTTTFPSNAVVTVAPYATLTLAGHTKNPVGTQYCVMTNGTLKIKGTWQTHDDERIDLDGGTLSVREDEEGAADSGTYINYLMLANGARTTGKPVRVGRNTYHENWIVAGSAPSFCDSGIVVTAKDGDAEKTFSLNVNDVAEGADFIVNGGITDYYSFYTDAVGYWNVHVAKNGAGTLALGGGLTLPNELSVNEGTLLLASNDLFKVSRKRQEDGTNRKAELWLADGAGLATAPATTNAVGALVVKGGTGTLDLGADSKLVLTSFTAENGGTLIVSDNLGKGATMRIEGLPVFTIVRNIRCGEDGKKKVRTNTDGNLVPYISGISIAVQ